MRHLRSYFIILLLSLCNAGLALGSEVIGLTQTACQFIEAENGVDHHYASRLLGIHSDNHSDSHSGSGSNVQSAHECERLNDKTAEQRLAKVQSLHLKAGDYVFRVSNRDVPYVLGFWLRGAGLSRFTLPSVSGGGIAMGQSRDYSIALEAGEYRYSCPLNPTPDYILIVE